MKTIDPLDRKGIPCVTYGYGEDAFVYYRVCPTCNCYVKSDVQSKVPASSEPNATCKKHGRVQMPFCCWGSDMDGDDENDKT